MRVFKYFAGELTSVGTTTTGAGIWLEGPAPSCVCVRGERTIECESVSATHTLLTQSAT